MAMICANRTSSRCPIRCSMCTKSSVQTLPPAIFVNGQPPNPATDVSTCVTPVRSAAQTFARPRP
jgi:hypothetical protein